MFRRIIPALVIVFVLGGVYYFYFPGGEAEFGYIYIEDQKYLVEIADTDAERARGLQNRDSIGRADGMLFIFERPGFYSFWMKDVRFPLDLVWVYNGKIVSISESVPVPVGESYPTYAPPQPITNVIEFEAGRSTKDNIKIGDSIRFEL